MARNAQKSIVASVVIFLKLKSQDVPSTTMAIIAKSSKIRITKFGSVWFQKLIHFKVFSNRQQIFFLLFQTINFGGIYTI